MYPLHVVVELDQELHEKMQKVAESLGIPIEPPAEMVELVLDVLVENHYLGWIARAEHASIPAEELTTDSIAGALNRLSEPRIARGVNVVSIKPHAPEPVKTWQEIWEELEKRHAGNSVMSTVLGMGQDQELWKQAYTTVFLCGQITTDTDRTWQLVESTYRLLKKRASAPGENG